MAAKPLTSEAIALTEKKMNMTLDDIIKLSKKPKKQRVSNWNQKFVKNAAQDKSAKVQRFMDTRSSLRQGALARRRSDFHGNEFHLETEAARKVAVAPIHNRAYNHSSPVNMNKPWLKRFLKPAKSFGTFGGGTLLCTKFKVVLHCDEAIFSNIGLRRNVKCIKHEVLRLWSWGWAPAVQKNAANGVGFIVKKQQQQVKAGPKQGSQTLDSLFANMKEQRMRVFSRQDNWLRRNGGRQPIVPWVRGRFGN